MFVSGGGFIYKGATFIVETTDDLPTPKESIGGNTKIAINSNYEEIVPKNWLVKMDNFIKTQEPI